MSTEKYCLDTNILIQAWQKYYAPNFCIDYWSVLNQLGTSNRIFLPEEVKDEIVRTDDELAEWVKGCKIPIIKTNQRVTEILSKIYSAHPLHKYLVDNTKARSLADPWVIAHALAQNATVVTKEVKVTAVSSKKIKIPNVCENLNIRCINDFKMINELNLKFNCKLQ